MTRSETAEPEARSAPSRVLVTGATGLLGGHVVRTLLDDGATEVVALVRDAAKAGRLLPADERVRTVVGDICDVDGVRTALRGMDAVVHTAAYFREYYQPRPDVDLLYRTNVTAVESLLHAAVDAEVPVLVHTSSTGTLGKGPAGAAADEDTPPAPDTERSAYRTSKVRSETVVREFCARYGLRVPIVLPGWMWGPGDAAPTSAGSLFLALAHGQLRAVPKAYNHVVDARDVAVASVRAASVGAGLRRYIVAGHRRSLADIAEGVATVTGAEVPRQVPIGLVLAVAPLMRLEARLRGRPAVADRRSIDVLRSTGHAVTSARAERELGVGFRSFDQTLRDTADWYRWRGMLARQPAPHGT